jgi:hypothetical protein
VFDQYGPAGTQWRQAEKDGGAAPRYSHSWTVTFPAGTRTAWFAYAPPYSDTDLRRDVARWEARAAALARGERVPVAEAESVGEGVCVPDGEAVGDGVCEALGTPDGLGAKNNTVWTRTFGDGATRVALDLGGGGARAACAPDAAGAWTIANTAQYFSLAATNSTTRSYNVSCTTACSTSWHTATAVMRAPFTAVSIEFHMQPGFAPARQSGSFDASCAVIEWDEGAPWCARARDPTCAPAGAPTSCIRWASGRATGNAC